MNPNIGEWMVDKFVIGEPDKKRPLALKNLVRFVSSRYTMITNYPNVGIAIGPKETESNLFFNAWMEKRLRNPVYSIHHHRCEEKFCENGGTIVLGDQDLQNCEQVETSYPITYPNGNFPSFICVLSTEFRD
jgi:hypothetical protein